MFGVTAARRRLTENGLELAVQTVDNVSTLPGRPCSSCPNPYPASRGRTPGILLLRGGGVGVEEEETDYDEQVMVEQDADKETQDDDCC